MQTIDTATVLVDRYFAAWNTTDAAQRARLVAGARADGGAYLDPVMRGKGHSGIEVTGFFNQAPALP